MSADLTFLTHEDLEVGESYLRMCCSFDGDLFFSRIVMLSDPDHKGRFELQNYFYLDPDFDSEPQISEGVELLELVGCPDGSPRLYRENYHRLLEDTQENCRALEWLARTQNTSCWLELIGVDEPQKETSRMKHEGFFFKEVIKKKADELEEGGHHGAYHVLMSAYLDSIEGVNVATH